VRRAYQRATLREVARVAGVSPSTASRVLNGGELHVSSDLSARVQAVAESLGYVSNQAARALRGSRTAVVLLASDPRTASIAAMAAGMEAAGREQGALVSLTAAGSSPAAHRKALEAIRGLRPRALVIASASFADTPREDVVPELERLEADGCSIVFIGDHDPPYPAVRFNDVEVGVEIGRLMGGTGRKRAAILTSAGHPALERRTRGFLQGLGAAGLDLASVRVEDCELTREGAKDAARRLAENGAPDLVLAGNDVLAIGAMNEFRRLGLAVPDDVAVSGVDDIPLSKDVTPPLTTMALPFDLAGRTAFDMAMHPQGNDIHLTGTLTVRASTPQ